MTVTALVWVLMVSAGQHFISYSPPVAELVDCQRMQAVITDSWTLKNSKCVQVNMVFPVSK